MMRVIMLVLVTVLVSMVEGQEHEQLKKNNQFDIYIFTQHWPYTTCFDWSEKGHSCNKIDRPRWSVHGLWPTRYGEIAPNFCNSSWHYSHREMEPILEQLATFWPDIEMRNVTDSLWSHEWTKHGTCAVQANDTELHTQADYFRTGCELASRNPLSEWLSSAGIVPSDDKEYSTAQFWSAIVSAAGVRPHIDCEKVDGVAVVKEIKLCYDKSLARVDCDNIVSEKSGEHMMGTCLRYPSFLYPATSSPGHSATASAGVAGIVCGVLAAGVIILGAGYYVSRRYSRRGRGYESL